MTTTLTVPFLAPIAVGTEIVVVAIEQAGLFSGWSGAAPLIVDRATGVLYGAHWVPDPIHAGDLDVERHADGRYRRAPGSPPLAFRVMSCLVRARGSGEHVSLDTVLRLEPLAGAAAYR
jgi:hypothetical protein